jgi:hypothetical protein
LGGALREADLIATASGRILGETVGQALERNSRRPEGKALDQQGSPCSRATVGLLQPAPTDAIRFVLIGKETRNLERAGITDDPVHTLYCDPEDDAWRLGYLPTLRLLAPELLGRGRPDKKRRELALEAGGRAARSLRALVPELPIPLDPEAACHLYLALIRDPEARTCACGCGLSLQVRPAMRDQLIGLGCTGRVGT